METTVSSGLRELAQFVAEKQKEVQTTVEIEGHTYSTKPLTLIADVSNPEPDALEVHSLGGFCEAIHAGVGAVEGDKRIVLIQDAGNVLLVDRDVDAHGDRFTYLKATLPNIKRFPFGSYLDPETFVIDLQTMFVPIDDPNSDYVYALKLACNITAEAVVTSQDDGISQQIGVRAGVVLQEKQAMRSRLKLQPYRTFPDIAQPESMYLFRAKQTGQQQPLLTLVEADNGAWILDAMRSINVFLKERIGDKVKIVS